MSPPSQQADWRHGQNRWSKRPTDPQVAFCRLEEECTGDGKDTLKNYGFFTLVAGIPNSFPDQLQPVAASWVSSDIFSKNRVDSLESAAVGNILAQSGPTLENTISSARKYQFTLCTLADLLFQK